MGNWTKGGKIDLMAILAKLQKWYGGKSERGGGCNNPPPPPERERGLNGLHEFSELVLARMVLLMGQSCSTLLLRSAKAREFGELW